MRVVDLEIFRQAGFKIVGRIVIATLQKTPRQNAKPQLHLIQPGAMFGRKVKDMLMGRIAQEGASLAPALQGLGSKWQLTPRSNQATHVQAPMGIEVVDHPIIPLHRGELLHDVAQMGGPIHAGTGLAEIPHELPRGNHK